MTPENQSPKPEFANPWPHRLAVALVCATFVLICAGALVTTQGAGMAFRDWPTSDGHNMFLYPWFKAASDKFVEHGHRLLGASVGLITIALVAAIWCCDRRRWLGWLAATALALVIAQGVLGGMRVRADAIQLAKIHGCTGPAFFALTVALSVFTSRFWRQTDRPTKKDGIAGLGLPAALATGIAYAQIVLGSQLRHVHPASPPEAFRIAVTFHILVAFILLAYSLFLLARALNKQRRVSFLARPAVVLAALVVMQIGLGASAWIVKYAWPAGLFSQSATVAGWTNTAGGWTQSIVVTSHVAIGSLILGTSVLLTLRALRWEGKRQSVELPISERYLVGAVL